MRLLKPQETHDKVFWADDLDGTMADLAGKPVGRSRYPQWINKALTVANYAGWLQYRELNALQAVEKIVITPQSGFETADIIPAYPATGFQIVIRITDSGMATQSVGSITN